MIIISQALKPKYSFLLYSNNKESVCVIEFSFFSSIQTDGARGQNYDPFKDFSIHCIQNT